MSEINRVSVIMEAIAEGNSVEVLGPFRDLLALFRNPSRYFILGISNRETVTMPLIASRQFPILGVNTRLHPVAVKAGGFGQIHNIELNHLASGQLRDHFEVKPLGVALSIEIIRQEQVVFKRTHFHCFGQVPVLEF